MLRKDEECLSVFFRPENHLRVRLSSGSLERRFFHCDAAVLNHSILDVSEE